LPLDPAFTANFLCLQIFGAFCNELTPSQRAAIGEKAGAR
jgi:hypothetical protein